MIFSSFTYILFLIVVVMFMMVAPKSSKKYILLAASYIFYAYWDWRFVLLMVSLSLINFFIGRKIETGSKKIWLSLGIVVNVSVLGVFKYYNFFIDSANDLLTNVGASLPLLNIILPVGISFIIFELISYIVDIYRGTSKSAKNVFDLGLLVAFFPHLIAGPILKPNHFLPQLDRDIKIKWVNVEIGAQIFMFGLIKKVIFADRLALFVDPVFANPQEYHSTTIWLAVIAYALQIYFDFSGYSDMAIGSAKILGFDIPRNFNLPYLSRNITEFWRRWHISLSTWLREYLYFPLGGNRKGEVRQYINLLVVMLIGGLWHGASWNFVLWGALHGLGLTIHKLYRKVVNIKETFITSIVSWLLTMIFVCITWVFFRSSDFSTSLYIIKKMFFINSIGIEWYPTSLLVILPIVIVTYWLGNRVNNYVTLKLSSFRGLFVVCFVILGLLFFRPIVSSPFIYFQF